MDYKREMMMMSFSIRLTNEERRIAESYANLHAISIGEAFKKALFEKIEDEYDITVAEEAYREYEEDPKTYSMEEVKEMLKL